MTRLLQDVSVTLSGHRLVAPEAVLDPATAALVAQREAAAYERGHRDGAASAEAAVAASADRLHHAVAGAVEGVARDLSALDERRADELVDLASRIAGAVLAHEPGPSGQVVLDRVLAAIRALDHGPFTIHAAPDDVALLSRAMDRELPPGTRVVADDGLAAGEARITGPWSTADLRRGAVLEVVAETLEGAQR